MLNEIRRRRIEEVLYRRLGRVRCAVEAVYHRHNVSAILRTCDALGLHHVHLVGSRRLKVSRGAARGAERWLDLHHHDDPEQAIEALRAQGARVFVADLDGAYAPEQVPVDRPVCLWFGAELVGVSAEARAAADGVVTLPMHGFSQSLNVSVAMALRPVAEAARALGDEALLPDARRREILARWLEREERVRDGIRNRGATSS